MSNEVEQKQAEKKECLCQNEFVRKVVAVALGTFFGVFFALSLFCALHRPPMMMYNPMMMPSHHCHCMHRHHSFGYDKFIQKKFPPKEFHIQKEQVEHQDIDKD